MPNDKPEANHSLRQRGFYWLGEEGGMTVGKWDGEHWWIVGCEMPAPDAAFSVQSERLIEP